MHKRHANEFQRTGFANSGRIAGIGINEDNYSHDALEKSYYRQPKFEHEYKHEDGDVVVYKAGEKHEDLDR